MSRIVTIYATFGSADEAAAITRTLVEERLAACANILGSCRSIYPWEGRIEDVEEVAALLKTRADAAAALIARLVELHSYDVPAAVVWPIEAAHPPYATWVVDSVGTRATPSP